MEGKEARVGGPHGTRVQTCRLGCLRGCGFGVASVCGGNSGVVVIVVDVCIVGPGQEGWSEGQLMPLDVCISQELQSKLGELLLLN